MHDVLALGQVGQAHAAGIQPFLPRLEVGELRLDLVVLDDPALLGVDEEHAAGAQPPAALDALGREVEHARLAADHDEAVGGLGPATRTQAVAVEGGADEGAVREDEGGGAVPRLHLHRVELVERAQLRVEVDLLLIGLGDHHHDRVRQAAAGQREQLEDLVEGCRVARARVQIGSTGRRSPSSSDSSWDWRARIQLRLPLTVLISPLWASMRSGCASGHDGNVFVE